MPFIKSKLYMMIRFIASLILLIVLTGSANAQDQSESKRFKHEKHGAIVFATGEDYELKCDIYQPKSDEPRPVMLAIHGGAWTTGSKFTMFRHARILANRGYVVMSINYRLAPDHKWPAQIHDCKHAVRWIREHAEEYNADPNRVYAFGYSAGGHLGAMLATTDEDDGFEGEVKAPYSKHSSRIDGLIGGGAPLEFSWIKEDSTALKFWLGETKKANPELYANASPTTFVTEDDPVMVFFHGTSDNLVPDSSPTRFVEHCKESNVDAELQLCQGGHAAAFTFTTNLINSLETLEAMQARKRCRSQINLMVMLANDYVKANGHDSLSIDDVGKYAVASAGITHASYEKLARNHRDGKQFEIRWSPKDGVIVSEAVGVDGEKLSSKQPLTD